MAKDVFDQQRSDEYLQEREYVDALGNRDPELVCSSSSEKTNDCIAITRDALCMDIQYQTMQGIF
ncbi:MAG: hypothetical protein WCJ39_03360 [bacterium]